MADLRSKLIRLAYARPELRQHLLPLLREPSLAGRQAFDRVADQQVSWTTRTHVIVKAKDFALKGKKFTFSGTADIRVEFEGRFWNLEEVVSYKAEATVPAWSDTLKITAANKLYRTLIREALKIEGAKDIVYELDKLGVTI